MLRKMFSRTPQDAIPEIDVTVADVASRARSLRATRTAHAAGRSNLSNVTGGYIVWERAGLPTETSSGAAA